MSSRPPPPPPIHPSSAFASTSPMAETHPPQFGHHALPPPPFLGHSYGAGPVLPPPAQLSNIYIPPLPFPGRSNIPAQPYSFGSQAPSSGREHDAGSNIERTGAYQTPAYTPVKSEASYSSRYTPPYSARSDVEPAKPAERVGVRSPQSSEARSSFSSNPPPNYAISHGHSASSYQDPSPSPAGPNMIGASASGFATKNPQLEKSTSRYEIRVRQQPLAARACGFGERDRRVIDPPPIIQLLAKDAGSASPSSTSADLRYPFNVVHCTLWSADGRTDETGLAGPDGRNTRRLMGTLVSSPFVGADENDVEGCFFCFPDLSCRTHGSYRLRFVLMRLEPMNLQPGEWMPTIAEVESDVFTVFNAKDFPGMRASTALTKALKRQGCAISVKKGNGRGREDDSEASEGSGTSGGKPSRKKSKH